MKVVIRASLIGCLLMTLLLRVSGDDGDNLPQISTPRRTTRGSATWTTGVWGSWSMWSACSRTCGQGVSTQTRECVEGSGYKRHQRLRQIRNHGNKSPVDEKLCLGVSRRVQLCKIQDCQYPVDPRRKMCEAFNAKPFGGRFYHWEPFFKDPGYCELRCQPKGERFFATLAKVVEDGTPCGPFNSEDSICVAGECKVVGCDGIIGSLSKVDQCGICGGDNATCERVAAYYTRAVMPVGYNSITVIPSGASHISITEYDSRQNRNLLALKTADDGQFILNGNHTSSRPGVFKAAGTVFRYRRIDPIGNEGQKITALGPTDRPIELFIFYQQRNRGVAYEYSLPRKRANKNHSNRNGNGKRDSTTSGPDSKPVPSPGYSSRNNVTELSGNHRQTSAGRAKEPFRKRENIKSNSIPSYRHSYSSSTDLLDENVDDFVGRASSNSSLVSTLDDNVLVVKQKPLSRPRTAEVSLEAAETSSVDSRRVKGDVLNDVASGLKNNGAYLWKMTGFGDCSQPCGRGLSQPLLKCFSKNPPALVKEYLCRGRPKPIVNPIVCNKQPCFPGWTMGNWTRCSATCGEGHQTRKVYCAKRESNSNYTPVADDLCSKLTSRPADRQPCSVACAKWKLSPWSKCTADCGKGTRTRKATCVDQGNVPVGDDSCLATKPDEEETCLLQACGGARWITTEWQSCSGSCDTGAEIRKVICLDGDKKVPYDVCDRDKRPEENRPCDRNTTLCRKGNWFVGPWSQCSTQCGPGSQSREVLCLTKEKIGRRQAVDDSLCSQRDKPVVKQKCDGQSCDTHQWYTGAWSTCSKSCGTGHQTREVFCFSFGHSLAEGCPSRSKPATNQSCNTHRCAGYLQDRTSGDSTAKVSPQNTVTNCADLWSNCDLVVQARLCLTPHYKELCCHSCSKPRARRKIQILKDLARKPAGH